MLHLNFRQDAKGVKQSNVALRLKLSNMPHNMMEGFIKNDFLKESHGAEILELSDFDNLSPWISRDDVMVEVFNAVVAKCGKTVTAKHFKEAVDAINQVIQLAQIGNSRWCGGTAGSCHWR